MRVVDSGVSSLSSRTNVTEENVGLPGSTGSRKPNCARCRNHHQKVLLKGHKRYCKYKNCICPKCNLTQERRVIMAKQTAERRRQVLDEARIRKGLPVPPSPPPESSQRLEVVTATPAPSSPPISAVPTTYFYQGSNPGNGLDLNVIVSIPSAANSSSSGSEPVPLESILLLLEMFQYQLDTTSLLYIILRDVTPDIFDAQRRIQEAQGVLRAERGRRTHWPFYYPTQSPSTTAVYKPHSTLQLPPLPWAFPYPYQPYLVTSSYNCEKKL